MILRAAQHTGEASLAANLKYLTVIAGPTNIPFKLLKMALTNEI